MEINIKSGMYETFFVTVGGIPIGKSMSLNNALIIKEWLTDSRSPSTNAIEEILNLGRNSLVQEIYSKIISEEKAVVDEYINSKEDIINILIEFFSANNTNVTKSCGRVISREEYFNTLTDKNSIVVEQEMNKTLDNAKLEQLDIFIKKIKKVTKEFSEQA